MLQTAPAHADTTVMRRPLALALLTLAALPATASAQAPVDDATAARAFADAALRAQPHVAAASAQLEAIGRRVDCVRAPRRHRNRVNELESSLNLAQTVAGFTRTVGPVLEQASIELHSVETTDPVLRSGRTAWRRLRRSYASFAALPAASVCAQVRAYARNGYRHTPETRRGMRAFHAIMAWDTADMDRRMQDAVKRMIQLGVPVADAEAFSGDLGG